jgi:5-oxoprolinase (ATP-hydrolysing)
MSGFKFGIDRGGTFTDIYCEYTDAKGGDSSLVYKLLSNDPGNYLDAPTEGIRRILEKVTGEVFKYPVNTSRIKWIRMGTTVATNALLERKGKNIALVITKGFKDLMLIGNQSRPDIFKLKIRRPEKLYKAVIEVDERVQIVSNQSVNSVKGVTGEYFEVLKPLDLTSLEFSLKELLVQGIDSLAISLVHSYSFRDHELQVQALAKNLGFVHVTCSSSIMPLPKFLPRTSTGCIDAYLTPILEDYIASFRSGFDAGLDNVEVLFMQSDGGLCSMDSFLGSKAILSGPAGGVLGYSKTGKIPLIGFDMGGTSTDVSRYDGTFHHIFETEIDGIPLQGAHLDINTVAAGGGSRLFYRSGLYIVGPESSSAHPGPLCYRKNGYLSVTDANLVLGRLLPDYFPKIFGETEDMPLDLDASYKGIQQITDEINAFEGKELTVEQVAMGFIKVANESMCRPIRAITSAKGYDPSTHTLACFGGAGGQHACAIARSLGIQNIIINMYSGVLSAYGLGLADIVEEIHHPACILISNPNLLQEVNSILQQLTKTLIEKLNIKGYKASVLNSFLHLRFVGTDTSIPVEFLTDINRTLVEFRDIYVREYGFLLENRDIVIDDIRIRGVIKVQSVSSPVTGTAGDVKSIHTALVHFETENGLEKLETPVYLLDNLPSYCEIPGPALIISNISCIVVETKTIARINSTRDVEIVLETLNKKISSLECDNVILSLFGHRFMSIAEQMGRVLQRTSISTNIKERLDYSCAIFDCNGGLVANAPHLPVHLGSMQEAVKKQIELLESWNEGEVVISNHPCAGGSHLPDITVITPVFYDGVKIFYVASRGHHADIGGITPGSMPPFSKSLSEEGVAIMSCKIVIDQKFQEDTLRDLFKHSRCLEDNISDLKAQTSANNKGIYLLGELIKEYTLDVVQAYMKHIQNAAGQSVRDLLSKIPTNVLSAHDYMDDGTCIRLKVTISNSTAVFDFSGTGPQVLSNLNSPEAVVRSAILYCLRCLVNSDIPLNQGCLDPISIIIPKNSILSPSPDSAVVGGNVETSQRITDIILKAFQASAASQGTMNNLTFGNSKFGFYETIGGGSGAGKGWDGESAVHTHMTNTRITDVEIIERRYPVLITEFSIRHNTGGNGIWKGGNGIVREILFLEEMELGILSERRSRKPFGIAGGKKAKPGINLLIRKDQTVINIGGKNQVKVFPGDKVRIMTPGGGGYGDVSSI